MTEQNISQQELVDVPTLRLTPDLTRSIIVLVFSVIFLAAGIEMVSQGNMAGWFLVTLFTLSIVASLSVILPGACYLEVDPAGVTVASGFRRKTYRWDQVERIGLFEVGMIRRVGVDLNRHYTGPERVPNYDKSASGFHVALPPMSGMEPEKLLDVMEQCMKASGVEMKV